MKSILHPVVPVPKIEPVPVHLAGLFNLNKRKGNMLVVSKQSIAFAIVLFVATFLVVVFAGKYAESQAEKSHGATPALVKHRK